MTSPHLIPVVALALVAAVARPAPATPRGALSPAPPAEPAGSPPAAGSLPSAIAPAASFRHLVTGNGHGFQVFDVGANAIKQYLERPYRYLRANPHNPDGEGIARRNLSFDTYFGIKAGAQAAWFGGRAASAAGYLAETNVIRSVITVNGITAESLFVSPFGYEGNALVMLLKLTNTGGAAQPVTAYSIHNFKLGSAPNPDAPDGNGEAIAWDGTAASETGPGGGAMVYAPIGGADVSSCADDAFQTIGAGAGIAPVASCAGDDKKNAFARELGTLAPGDTRWWGVAVLFDPGGDAAAARAAWTAFLAGRTADALLADLLAEWDAWRTPPVAGLTPAETAIWRQSEAVLRMAQVREPYREAPRRKGLGMILASLPPGIWHTSWVRDAVYAIVALARTGHHDMARAGLDFMLDADAGKYASYVRGAAYRISTVRYFGDGEEESDFSGAPTRNIELDGWGLTLWGARAYVDASGDLGWLAATTRKGDTVYDALRDGVAEPLVANLEPSGIPVADASIWEVHWGNREHFLYTAAAAARGFCDMATLARRAGRGADIARYRELHDRALAAIERSFVDADRVLAGSLERLARGADYRDGSSVELITWSLLPATDGPGEATLGAFSALQTPAGGYKRVEGSTDPYDTDEWILLDLRASAAFRRAGDAAKADQLLGWVSGQASANHNLLPELYNTHPASGPIGAYAGSIPMVGYGAGAYLMTLLDRAGAYEPADCGRLGPGEEPDPDEQPGDDDGVTGRTGVACACSGGRGAPGSAAALALAGLWLARRRRRDRRDARRGGRSRRGGERTLRARAHPGRVAGLAAGLAIAIAGTADADGEPAPDGEPPPAQTAAVAAPPARPASVTAPPAQTAAVAAPPARPASVTAPPAQPAVIAAPPAQTAAVAGPSARTVAVAAPPARTASIESISSRDTVGAVEREPAGDAGLTVNDVRFELHGYARMPLASQGRREPYLVDDDALRSGFAYTRLYEPDWSELFLSARRGNYKAEFGLFASLHSDRAPPQPEHRLGVAQASVTAERFLDHEPLSVQLGVFWDRFGYVQPYDTYVFGRTHQGGVKVAYALPRGARVQAGLGFHRARPDQDLGMTPIAHVAGSYPLDRLQLGGYLLRTWTRDRRQLSPIEDGTLYVAGADARYRLPGERGSAYLAFAYHDMNRVLSLAPALEAMHSTGGRGLTENFLGTDASEHGTGRMYTLAGDAPIAIGERIGARVFGMISWVRSRQVDEIDPLANRDRRLYLKWGIEPSYRVLPKLQLSARYDRVVLDVYDAENSFRVLSPRVSFPLDGWVELFAMYSHYWYGDKIQLRPGQVPLATEPDANVFKVQAQVVW